MYDRLVAEHFYTRIAGNKFHSYSGPVYCNGKLRESIMYSFFIRNGYRND